VSTPVTSGTGIAGPTRAFDGVSRPFHLLRRSLTRYRM